MVKDRKAFVSCIRVHTFIVKFEPSVVLSSKRFVRRNIGDIDDVRAKLVYVDGPLIAAQLVIALAINDFQVVVDAPDNNNTKYKNKKEKKIL